MLTFWEFSGVHLRVVVPFVFCSSKVRGEGHSEAGAVHVDPRQAQVGCPFAGPVGAVPELRKVEGAAEVHGPLGLHGPRAGDKEEVLRCEPFVAMVFRRMFACCTAAHVILGLALVCVLQGNQHHIAYLVKQLHCIISF